MGVATGTKSADPRLLFIESPLKRKQDDFCQAVFDGLHHDPKWLPSRFFYDRAGSELFERITELAEYYPTRCEQEILTVHALEIVANLGDQLSIVEFGSGSSTKTRTLIEAALATQPDLSYVTVDISRDFLRESAMNLLEDYRGLSVCAVAAEYSEAIALLPESDDARLILFLGSNIGNFCEKEGTDFLASIRKRMSRDDRLLVGVDLEKDRKVLDLAYNDPEGVTAEFNKNLLARINRELGGNFVLDQFRHTAPYDEEEHRIEMRLVSSCDQTVRISDLEEDHSFVDGEYIVTEWSHKYTRESFEAIAGNAGLEIVQEWRDSEGWFAEFLVRVDR
jgi:dimethylhistidine N-methyltransferase